MLLSPTQPSILLWEFLECEAEACNKCAQASLTGPQWASLFYIPSQGSGKLKTCVLYSHGPKAKCTGKCASAACVAFRYPLSRSIKQTCIIFCPDPIINLQTMSTHNTTVFDRKCKDRRFLDSIFVLILNESLCNNKSQCYCKISDPLHPLW